MLINRATRNWQVAFGVLRNLESSLFPTSKSSFNTFKALANRNYTSEEQVKVLSVINDLNRSKRNIVNKTLTEKLANYVQSNGRLESLEQLLKVPGLGPKTLRKACDEILGATTEEEPVIRNKTVMSLTIPDLSQKLITDLRVIGSVQVGVNTVSWSAVDLGTKEVIDWRVVPLPPWDRKTGLIGLHNKTKEIFSNMGEANIYVFEDTNWTTVGTQGPSSLNVHRAEITAILVSLLNQASEASLPRAVFLRSRLTARVFNKIVGSEKVSYQKTVEDIMQHNTVGSHTNLYIGPWLKSEYLQRPSSDREAMCEALLMVVCFLDIVVYRRAEVLNGIKARRKAAADTS